MNRLKLFFAIAIAVLVSSCDSDTSYLGTSIVPDADNLQMATNSFPVSTASAEMGSVVSRTPYGYLGRIKDVETGMYLSANYMFKFAVQNVNYTEMGTMKKVNVTQPDGSVMENILVDSCEVMLYLNRFYGDSLTVMKTSLLELKKTIPENSSLYSDMDPEENGYVRPASEGGITMDKSFAVVDFTVKDSLRHTANYTRNVVYRFPQEQYVARDGKVYYNYGSYIMTKYFENPDNFQNIYLFNKNVCPGFYVKMKSGLGAMLEIYNAQMILHSSNEVNGKKTTYNTYLMGTEEVQQFTRIENEGNTIDNLLNDNEATYVKSPAGITTIATLPIDEVMKSHENDSINSASITFKRVNNNDYSNQYNLSTPTTLLMIEADSIKSFFEGKKLYDNIGTYIAAYSSSDNGYVYNNISNLLSKIYNNKVKCEAKDASWVLSHPNWNKIALVPVKVEYDGSGSVSRVTNDMSLSNTRLQRGTAQKDSPLTLSIIYSKYGR